MQPQGQSCILYVTSVDTAWSDQMHRLRESPQKGEREIIYRHARCTMHLDLTSNRQPDSLMCLVYTNTQLPSTFNQICIRSTRSDIAGTTTNRVPEITRAQAGNITRDWQSITLPLSYLSAKWLYGYYVNYISSLKIQGRSQNYSCKNWNKI